MLEVDDINVHYADSHTLRGVSFSAREGEVVCLLGRNGAGKATTILTTMGYLKPRSRRIVYCGRDITTLRPYEIARLGVGYVPQERGIFPSGFQLSAGEQQMLSIARALAQSEPLYCSTSHPRVSPH